MSDQLITGLVLAVEASDTHGAFSWTAVLIGVVLLTANGYFVAAEIALLAARRARVEELADGGDVSARRALKALRELSITFSGAQLGITMASFGLGAVAEPALAALFEGWLGVTPLPPGVRTGLAFAFGLGVVVFLHMVVGEMAPKNLALARAEAVSLRLARSFSWYVTVFRPVIVVLNAAANGLVRLTGVDPIDEQKLVHTPEELLLAVRESGRHGHLPAQDERWITAALELAGIDAGSAMTPRVDLEALPDTATAAEAIARAAETGRTRLPVFSGDVDHVVGLIHVKDVLTRDVDELDGLTVTDLLRPLPAVPESRDLERLLRDMLEERSHAVLVVDEFGGTAGMLTLEDVLEEIVGDIEDEFDEPERVGVDRNGQVWLVEGTLRRDELERLTGLALPDGEADTLSGYMTEQLGRLVAAGDQVLTGDGWRLRVRSLEGRRAGEVEVRAPEEGRT